MRRSAQAVTSPAAAAIFLRPATRRASARRSSLQPWRCFSAGGRSPEPLPREGLAVIRNVRPSNGEHAASWIQDNVAKYYGPRDNLDFRSPSAFALRQMDDRFSFFKPDVVVLDLGCFPGGWSQVAVERTEASSSSSQVIGVDTVSMEPLNYHTFIRGDVEDEATDTRILEVLGDRRADVVLSDVAPPTTGLKLEDHLRTMQTCLFSARIMERTLTRGGWFVAKLLWGQEQQHWRTYLESRFRTVRTIKPPASRPVHREMFMVCRGFYGRHSVAEEVQRPGLDFEKHEGFDRWDSELRRRQKPRS